MQEKKKKIGIMGGTFDPIHISHLILAETAYEQFSLDKVLFLPAGNPPHKRNRKGGATDLERVEMVRRAIAGNSHFQLCLDEMNAEDYSYTYRTLEQMRAEHPDTEFYFIVGADSLFDFEQWREPERICRAASILVAVRIALFMPGAGQPQVMIPIFIRRLGLPVFSMDGTARHSVRYILNA